MSERQRKKLKSRLLVLSSGFMLVLSLAGISVGTFAWFTTNRTATVSFASMTVKGDQFASFSADFYRYDGLRYSYPSKTITDDSNTVVTETFSMLEYDTIIKEKNLTNNLVCKISFALASGETATTATITANASNTSILKGEGVSTYHLSDLIEISCLNTANKTVNATTNSGIFSEVSADFTSASSTSSDFVSVDDKTATNPTATTKNPSLPFTVSLSGLTLTNTITIYLNIDYMDYLVKAIVAGYGTYEPGSTGTYGALNDTSFVLEVS